jgi:hypothetical protein
MNSQNSAVSSTSYLAVSVLFFLAFLGATDKPLFLNILLYFVLEVKFYHVPCLNVLFYPLELLHE